MTVNGILLITVSFRCYTIVTIYKWIGGRTGGSFGARSDGCVKYVNNKNRVCRRAVREKDSTSPMSVTDSTVIIAELYILVKRHAWILYLRIRKCKKKESAALNAPRPTTMSLSVTDSTVSIADLWNNVNRSISDISQKFFETRLTILSENSIIVSASTNWVRYLCSTRFLKRK